MKQQTLELLKKHFDAKAFDFEAVDGLLVFSHNLSDDEIIDIVYAEYGTSVHQSVPDLFQVIIKKLLRKGIEYAKTQNTDT